MTPKNRLLMVSLSVGVFYGAVARFFFGYKLPWGPVFTVMSVSFLFLVPLVLGFLVVYVGEGEGPPWGWWRWIVTPWVAALLALGGALALAWEGIICVFLWIPVFLTMSSLGGVAASLVRRLGRPSGTRPYVLVFSLLLPFALAPLEHRLPLPTERREVRTAIAIDAPVETVWKNIERVPKIEPQEQRWSLFHAIGFPRPVEATLSREGVGGVRHATFERGVLFVETITDWQPGRRLAFSIHADPTSIPPTTLDEHVTVGGPFFDVLEGVYEIEPVAPGRVILHLASTHRLSTHFNAYSGLWTDLILRNVQEYILEILKRRCEAAPA